MSAGENKREAHINSNMNLRALKARKIAAVLGIHDQCQASGSLLEVGTGSGGIAYYFSHCPSWKFQVFAVDVVDNRVLSEGYSFQLVEGSELPFPDASFDFIISNHVIEHVGNESDQLTHLREIKRVLKPNGVGYLAVPNRWMLVEPHYRLVFLSWWPKSWRSLYLKWRRGIAFYDCEPLSLIQVEELLDKAQLTYENKAVAAIRLMLELEFAETSLVRKLCERVPDSWFYFLRKLIPTLIYRIGL